MNKQFKFLLNKTLFLSISMLILISVFYGLHLRYTNITQTVIDSPIRADAYDYYHYASNLHHYGVYSRQPPTDDNSRQLVPDALRAPGFPIFASTFITSSVTTTLENTLIAQSVLQVICFLLLTYIFIREFRLIYACIASMILWSFPHFVSINTYYLSESVFTSTLVLAFVAFWFSKEGKNIPILLFCALFIGLASLIRPVLDYFPLYLLFLSALFAKQHFKTVLYFSATACLPIIAWKIRNYITLGHLSDPTLMINAIYHGSFPNFMYNQDPGTFGVPYRSDPDAERVYEGIGVTLQLIWMKAKANIFLYLNWYIIGKQLYLWSWSIVGGFGDIFIYPIISSPYLELPDMIKSRAAHLIIHPFWVVSGLLSALIAPLHYLRFKSHPSLLVLFCSLSIIYIALISSITAPFPRYSIPFKWIILFLSIYGIKEFNSWLLQIIQSRKSA